jgi:hypothetical protein
VKSADPLERNAATLLFLLHFCSLRVLDHCGHGFLQREQCTTGWPQVGGLYRIGK